MSEDPKSPDEAQEEAEARAFILARRARFVAAAMASAGVVVSCGGESIVHSCLGANPETGGMSGTGNVSIVSSGGVPQPCLSVPSGGTGAVGVVGVSGALGSGGRPMPCLEAPSGGSAGIPPWLGGTTGSGRLPNTGGIPQVCLGMAATGGTGGGGAPPDADAGADAAAKGGTSGAGGSAGSGGAPLPCLGIAR